MRRCGRDAHTTAGRRAPRQDGRRARGVTGERLRVAARTSCGVGRETGVGRNRERLRVAARMSCKELAPCDGAGGTPAPQSAGGRRDNREAAAGDTVSKVDGHGEGEPMWRPPGAIIFCWHTPGCGALRAPHPGLCMVRPSGPNLADRSDDPTDLGGMRPGRRAAFAGSRSNVV